MNPPLWQSPDLPALLAAELATPTDPRWRDEFSPELSYGRHAGPARSNSRVAAVAIVLCWDGRQWSLPLTVRNALLSRHGGQVSLPGGLLDAGESPREAASRELGEELGQCPPLQWIGELSPLFVYASDAMVTTCIAAVDHWPDWTPQPAEVDRVLKLELRDLLDQHAAPPLEVKRGPFRFRAPQLLVEGQSAWGATAVMLGELRGRLLRIADQKS
ncbi:MAG: CoA pyrophosphatase [Pirellulales bacterium]|nr:CoA pyrophosphatase [Pirellulales bacterium]